MMKPISNTKKGDRVHIRCLGCSCEDACQLKELGCIEGASGKIVSNYSRVIVQLGDTRLALSKELASSILVSSE